MTRGDAEAQTEIRNLLATCTQAGDARKADAYAETFAPNGILHLAEQIEGREAIRAWMAAPPVIPQTSAPSPGFVSHHLTTSRIDLTAPDTAKGRTYWFVITSVGLDHSGYYDDQFVRLEETWRIAHRKLRILWVSPQSLIATPTAKEPP